MPRFPELDPGQLLGGLVFSAAGLGIIVLAFALDETDINGPRWLSALVGLLFLIAGLWILEVYRLWENRFPNIDWGAMLGGLIGVLFSLLLISAMVISDDSSFSVPRWIAYLAGAAFLFASLIGVVGAAGKGGGLVTRFLVALLLTCFGAVAAGVSIVPGKEESVGSLQTPIGQFTFSAPGIFLDFLHFAPGALILGGMALYMWAQLLIELVKRLRRKKS